MSTLMDYNDIIIMTLSSCLVPVLYIDTAWRPVPLSMTLALPLSFSPASVTKNYGT